MKNLTILLLVVLAGVCGAQNQPCGTDEMIFRRHGDNLRQLIEQRALRIARASGLRQQAASNYTIPVVVHILHRGGYENVSDQQVNLAIDRLNKNFNRLNPDTGQVVNAFKPLIGDAQVSFQLARIDPNGYCTNGIIRYYTEDQWKMTFQDFAYTWSPDRYLNIYVVRAFQVGVYLTAYAAMPSFPVPPMEDAIVILWSSFLDPDILTHEAGHYLDLQHTFGTGPFGLCGDDNVADTPPTGGYFSCDINNAAKCNPPVIENVQNFMDYSKCHHMFTHGQVQLMHATLASTVAWRNSLSTSLNHYQTGITHTVSYCLPKLDIYPYDTIFSCLGASVTVKSYTSNSHPTGYQWGADNGAAVKAAQTPTATVVINNTGYTHVTCTASNANGGTTRTLVIYAPKFTVQHPNILESFEVPLNKDWRVVSTGTTGWQYFPGAASHGTVSAYVPGESLNGGEETWLETPSYDLGGATQLGFTFKYAYARYHNTHKDQFTIDASTDCGGTWKTIYQPTPTQLASGSGETDSVPLVPLPQHWKTYDFGAHPNFNPLRGERNVRFRFRFAQDAAATKGNRLFLDQINIFRVTSVAAYEHALAPGIFPSPSDGRFTVEFNAGTTGELYIRLFSADGRLAMEEKIMVSTPGRQQFHFNRPDISEGLYFLTLEGQEGRAISKLLIDR